MKTDPLLDEIREANLTYLMLAQRMIRDDRASAVYRLGISEDFAHIIEGLTAGQLLKMAGTNTLLCRFRFDDRVILGLLTGHGKAGAMAASHAAILMANQPVAEVE